MTTFSEPIFDIWARRNPYFETRLQETVLNVLSDYGVGASEMMSTKGKILGAAYEVYIMAFFIGLYQDQRRPLTGETKNLGQPVDKWGNLDSKKDRKAYPKLREYIFTALVARTDINWIEVDKGTIKPNQVADMLTDTMEEYANYGFHYMEDMLKEDPNSLYNSTSFLDIFLKIVNVKKKVEQPDQSEKSIWPDIKEEVPEQKKRARIGQKIEPLHKNEPESLD